MSFNPGYKADFNDKEAAEARRVRDQLLNALADCMRRQAPPDGAEVLALVERYRFEFIDAYLYKSTPIILFGLATTMAADPRNKQAYDAYGDGLAEYLSQAFRAYYYHLKKQDAGKS